jgi:menaquinone-specific isochorismate synthase
VSIVSTGVRTAVRTRRISDDDPLLTRLPADEAVAVVRGGEGLVGWGTAGRWEGRGEGRFADAGAWWGEVVAGLEVHDEVGLPGTGPVALASFAFDPSSPRGSAMVVPRVVVGRRGGITWLTTIGDVDPDPRPARSTPAAPRGVRYADGSAPVTSWQGAVATAVDRIRAGELDKVVLAHDLLATADEPIDARYLLERLTERHPGCWVFSLDGLVGATPELLVRREKGEVAARVLAGTLTRGAEALDDGAALLGSTKDLSEHRYAVQSLTEVLRRHCVELEVPESPSVLQLADVLHLATDVRGRLLDDSSALELAGALHPTAAVGGTPKAAALSVIAELEEMDRGRYAGPVGWLDASGDGEWCVALRCGQLDGRSLQLLAGCGIVAGSEPAAEVAEAWAKLAAMRDALEAGPG